MRTRVQVLAVLNVIDLSVGGVRMQVLRLHVCIYFAQKIFKLVPTFPVDRLLSGRMLRGITGCERRNC